VASDRSARRTTASEQLSLFDSQRADSLAQEAPSDEPPRRCYRTARRTVRSSIDRHPRFFTEIGEEIQATVTSRRDEILGPPRPNEAAEAYRLRSYQALAAAEELVMADHHLLQSETIDQDEADPITADYFRDLALLNETIHTS
jgi:hypothetical protein